MNNLNQSIQSIVFTYAWMIRRNESNVENPLRESWKRVKLAFRLLTDGTLTDFLEAYRKAKFCSSLRRALKYAGSVGQAVSFAYMTKGSKKKPSTLRQAIGTALTDGKYNRTTDKKRPPSATGIYFDEEKNGSRSFKIAKLVESAGFSIVPIPVFA